MSEALVSSSFLFLKNLQYLFKFILSVLDSVAVDRPFNHLAKLWFTLEYLFYYLGMPAAEFADCQQGLESHLVWPMKMKMQSDYHNQNRCLLGIYELVCAFIISYCIIQCSMQFGLKVLDFSETTG